MEELKALCARFQQLLASDVKAAQKRDARRGPVLLTQRMSDACDTLQSVHRVVCQLRAPACSATVHKTLLPLFAATRGHFVRAKVCSPFRL
ncbi:MAG: hypothetical protein MHM6MM_008904 [Cercozoa sp. M6MM]